MTDQHAAQRRRNRAMSDWIRQGISAPSLPLDPSQFPTSEPATEPPAQAPATSPDSMNDLIRGTVRERPRR